MANWRQPSEETIALFDDVLLSDNMDKIGGLIQTVSDAIAQDPGQIGRILTSAEGLIVDATTLIGNIEVVVSDAGRLVGDVEDVVATTDHTVTSARELVATLNAAAASLPEAGESIPRIITAIEASIAQLDDTVGMFGESADDLEAVLQNLSEIDLMALRRLFIETRIRVHVFPTDIE